MSRSLAELVSLAAVVIEQRQVELVDEVYTSIRREINVLDGDDAILDLLRKSVQGNVALITEMLLNDVPLKQLHPPQMAVEYALRLAQRGAPGNALVRAYTIGKDNFVNVLIPQVQMLDASADDQFLVLQVVSTRIGQYIDHMSQFVYDVYEAERVRWLDAQGTVRASLIRDVLADREISAREFEEVTSYGLGGRHLAMVLWAGEESAVEVQRSLARVVNRTASAAGGARPLITAVDRVTAWAWLPLVGDVASAVAAARAVAVDPTCRVAFGLVGDGTAGFRRSHVQAAAARRVALARPGAHSVVSFGDEGVAITSVLAEDLDSTRAWVGAVLGPLAADSEAGLALRDTMRTFLALGGSHTETAAAMNLHRNTVRYRIGRAYELLASGAEPSRLDLGVALTVCHYLGSTVLAPA